MRRTFGEAIENLTGSGEYHWFAGRYLIYGASAPAGVALAAATVAGHAGSVTVTWTAPADNGRPITKYVVKAGGKETEVTETATTLTGLGDGATVQVEVTAVNEAGPGTAATASAWAWVGLIVLVLGSSVRVINQ